MNRIEQELKSRQGIINGRRWKVSRRHSSPCEVSELKPSIGGFQFMPGHWDGKPKTPFPALEQVGSERRRALYLPAYRRDLRRVFLARAYSWLATAQGICP